METNNKVPMRKSLHMLIRAWRIWGVLCPGVFVSQFFRAVVKAASPYVTIWLSAQLINELAGRRSPDALFFWVCLILGTQALLQLTEALLTRWVNYQNDRAKRVDDRIYMDKMLELDYPQLDRAYVHDLYSQMCQNENWSGWGLARTREHFEPTVTAILQIVGGIGLSVSLFTSKVPEGNSMAFLNHPMYAGWILLLLLVVAVLASVCRYRGNQYWPRYAEEARLGNRLFSFYGFMARERNRALDLRMYSQQENVCRVYMEREKIFCPGSQIAKWAKGPIGLWMALASCLTVVLTAVSYLFVCLKAWGGAFGVGSVTQYIGAITQLFLGVAGLLGQMGLILFNGSFLQDSFAFLDVPNTLYRGSLTTEKRSDRQYEVELRHVSFQYPDREEWVLRDVNLKFRVGSRLAVVGRNGSGKTTFIKLLCRLYDPTEGQILLNGIDIRKYRYEDYTALFSVVFQDFKLLALPLGENVAGSAVYDRQKVHECLQKAGLDENRFMKGLDTHLYKNLDKEGVDVSGGEAQKIAIARALYKDAPFIILDEPTAALDPIAEADIYSHFDEIAGDRTAVYISHRLSSCQFCDEIVVFDEGAVVQQGTHQRLLEEKEGLYATLWNAQAQYYAQKNTAKHGCES